MASINQSTEKKKRTTSKTNGIKKKSFFDHVNHIRKDQSPMYYTTLSDDDKKSFNHFMILRALSMDADIVEEMAELYAIFDKIPSAQFYQLLIAIVPKSTKFYPWVKSKKFKHHKELLKIFSERFNISMYQSNDYMNLLLRSNNGKAELEMILQSTGLSEKEINKLLEGQAYE